MRYNNTRKRILEDDEVEDHGLPRRQHDDSAEASTNDEEDTDEQEHDDEEEEIEEESDEAEEEQGAQEDTEESDKQSIEEEEEEYDFEAEFGSDQLDNERLPQDTSSPIIMEEYSEEDTSKTPMRSKAGPSSSKDRTSGQGGFVSASKMIGKIVERDDEDDDAPPRKKGRTKLISRKKVDVEVPSRRAGKQNESSKRGSKGKDKAKRGVKEPESVYRPRAAPHRSKSTREHPDHPGEEEFELHPEVIHTISQMSFVDDATKVHKDALALLPHYHKMFMMEAIQRAAAIANKDGNDILHIEHLEKVLPQLLLDF